MIIQNGTIEVKTKTGGGIDPETGYPVKGEAAWGEPIPCQWIPNRNDMLGRINGEHFIIAHYVVLIEAQPFNAEQVRLRTLDGRDLGEFSLMYAEPLDAVCQIRLTI
ncbi:hypothetical protein [Alistipes putredinis]|uniref:hypothetical protein n=2 Tax=Alistipes TaxID=239759 RepID=UPI003A8A0AE2